MTLPRRRFLHLAAGAAALPAVSRVASAQAYPSRPIILVVPFPPGGPTDLIGRMVGEWLRLSFGQSVIIENVTGANGSIGVGRVARATPDGHTLVLGLWNTHVSNGAVYTLAYDVLRDFEPIVLLSTIPSLIVARKSLPADDLKGFIAWLKANSDKATEGHVGIGSIGHVGGILFQNMSGTSFQFVPYRGIGPAMQNLVAGQIDMLMSAPSSALPQALDLFRQLGDELVVGRLLDVDPLNRHADLARIHHPAPGGGVRRPVEVGVVENDHRILAAEL